MIARDSAERRLLFTSGTDAVILGGERRNQSFRQAVNPQMKGRTIMGDKSPKATHKHDSQKQAKADQFKKAKQQAAFAKQPIGKKK